MRALLALSLSIPLFSAVTIDRIAVIVDNHVIKDSDIDREVRVTSYLNNEKLAFGPAERRKAAGRLVDQAIIRREIDLGRYAEANEQDTAKLLADTLRTHPSPRTYGLTEDQLRRALHWQLTVLRFIDLRFRPVQGNTPGSDPFIAWLDQTRNSTSIQYREEELR